MGRHRAPSEAAKCHPDRKYHALDLCRECYQGGYRAKFKKKAEANAKAWRAARPEYAGVAKYQWRKRHPEKAKAARWREKLRQRGITQAEFDRVIQGQSGVCAICWRAKPLDTDHDHRTGKFRGLLCRACNAALGLLKEDPQLFQRAVDYLAAANEQVA